MKVGAGRRLAAFISSFSEHRLQVFVHQQRQAGEARGQNRHYFSFLDAADRAFQSSALANRLNSLFARRKRHFSCEVRRLKLKLRTYPELYNPSPTLSCQTFKRKKPAFVLFETKNQAHSLGKKFYSRFLRLQLDKMGRVFDPLG